MKCLILVDVCNFLHRLPDYRDRLDEGIDQLAEQLLQQIRCLHDLEHRELHLIIDGKGQRLEQQFPEDSKTLSLVYSASGQSADTIIETWLLRLGKDWSVTVASEDRGIMNAAMAHGADILSADQLLDWANRVQLRQSRASHIRSQNSSANFENRLEGLS
jgi:predicted RNA-binding protein with PIN domain